MNKALGFTGTVQLRGPHRKSNFHRLYPRPCVPPQAAALRHGRHFPRVELGGGIELAEPGWSAHWVHHRWSSFRLCCVGDVLSLVWPCWLLSDPLLPFYGRLPAVRRDRQD